MICKLCQGHRGRHSNDPDGCDCHLCSSCEAPSYDEYPDGLCDRCDPFDWKKSQTGMYGYLDGVFIFAVMKNFFSDDNIYFARLLLTDKIAIEVRESNCSTNWKSIDDAQHACRKFWVEIGKDFYEKAGNILD